MKTGYVLTLVWLTAALSGCGENSFGGGSGKSGGGDRASSSENPEDKDKGKGDDAKANTGDDGLNLEPPPGANKEQEAIGRCLKAWGGSHPFDKSVYENYRKIHAAVTIFGNGGNAVEDTEVTEGPSLTVITAGVNVLGSANYLLMNPKGWYCIVVDVNVKAQTTIQLQCSAKLADSRVQVNVGSNASPTSAIGVNVFSDVKVERKKSAEGEGC